MVRLCVSLFGKFSVKCQDEALPGFDTLKVQELFCYLLLYRSRPHARESLAGLLWGDNSTSQAKRYLSKALWQLQSALSQAPLSQAPDGGNIVVVEPEWIQLDLESDFWLDVAVFEQAYDLVQEVPGWRLDTGRVQLIQEAVQWYEGDLLEGWYQDWCLCERERLQFLYLTLLDKLVRYCEAQGEYEAGRAFGYKILRLDRAREQAHRQLMRLYYLAGDRTGAMRQYRQCRQILMEELGVSPSRRTEELYARIRADEPVHPPQSSKPLVRPEPQGSDLRLQHLVDKMKRLRLELQMVERDLRSFSRSVGAGSLEEV